MQLERIGPEDLVAGDRVLWNLHDDTGKVLIPKGKIISNESLLARLLSMGLYADKDALRASREEWREARLRDALRQQPAGNSSLALLMAARQRLNSMVSQLENTIKTRSLAQSMDELSQSLIAACMAEPDVSIAMILLRQEGKYAVRHMVNSAIVTALVCNSLEKSVADTRSIVSAALTMNIGMVEFQDQLKEQSTELTPAQRARLERHPMMGADMLREAGITDQLWLDSVEQHHECIDGSGYPHGYWSDHIVDGARIVSLADLFCARVTPRSYRPAVASNVALKGILLERGKSIDQTIAMHFIKTVGIFPPGMLVRLANGEIGVVTRAGDKAATPVVKSILSREGQKLGLPVQRDTALEQFAIKETVDPKQLSAYVNMEAIWG